ncbi:MAG TPA: hypothetical protein EYQ82_12330 [Dehalococcoidia bacterium]|nr:hypothetical protein [Dehalococcoidia bacterium]
MLGPLVGVLALGVIAAVACASPAGSGPGDAAPAVSAPPTTLSEPVTAGEETAPPDPEATPEQTRAVVANVQALQRIAAASVQLDVDAFAEIKPGGPRDVDPRRYRQLRGSF